MEFVPRVLHAAGWEARRSSRNFALAQGSSGTAARALLFTCGIYYVYNKEP